mmetsp:Transcript_121929/g.260229  ORF Transcript_121929/g.260229 Transcript_121929/m.260229 type:complete len:210 (-) Transcript_121929:1106-1735(-)
MLSLTRAILHSGNEARGAWSRVVLIIGVVEGPARKAAADAALDLDRRLLLLGAVRGRCLLRPRSSHLGGGIGAASLPGLGLLPPQLPLRHIQACEVRFQLGLLFLQLAQALGSFSHRPLVTPCTPLPVLLQFDNGRPQLCLLLSKLCFMRTLFSRAHLLVLATQKFGHLLSLHIDSLPTVEGTPKLRSCLLDLLLERGVLHPPHAQLGF